MVSVLGFVRLHAVINNTSCVENSSVLTRHVLPTPPVVSIRVVVHLAAVLLFWHLLVEHLCVLFAMQTRPPRMFDQLLCNLEPVPVAHHANHVHRVLVQCVNGDLLQNQTERGRLHEVELLCTRQFVQLDQVAQRVTLQSVSDRSGQRTGLACLHLLSYCSEDVLDLLHRQTHLIEGVSRDELTILH